MRAVLFEFGAAQEASSRRASRMRVRREREHLIGPGVHERVFVCRRSENARKKDGEANQAAGSERDRPAALAGTVGRERQPPRSGSIPRETRGNQQYNCARQKIHESL